MDSDDYTTDEGKRKNNQPDLKEIFGRSAKIRRTPDKKEKHEDKLEIIIEMIQGFKQEVREDLREIREEQKQYRKEMKELKEENEKLKKENGELKAEMHRINEKLEVMDREKRRNNVVVQGLQINTKNEYVLKDGMQDFLKKRLEVDVHVKNAIRIGDKTCLIQLGNTTDKIEVMKNKSKLRNLKDERIYINEDWSKEEREIQKTIRMVAKEEEKKGKTVKIGYRKLIIGNTEWKWDPCKKELKPPGQNTKN